MRRTFIAALWIAALFAAVPPAGSAAGQTARPPTTPELRLYTLDCGRIDFDDMKGFSDTGEHDGEGESMSVLCFLIHHGSEWMLWDAGRSRVKHAYPSESLTDGRTHRRSLDAFF